MHRRCTPHGDKVAVGGGGRIGRTDELLRRGARCQARGGAGECTSDHCAVVRRFADLDDHDCRIADDCSGYGAANDTPPPLLSPSRPLGQRTEPPATSTPSRRSWEWPRAKP